MSRRLNIINRSRYKSRRKEFKLPISMKYIYVSMIFIFFLVIPTILFFDKEEEPDNVEKLITSISVGLFVVYLLANHKDPEE